ncbi:hypothetical protein FQN54_004307 [Arachnomyces sp. PD_36]|nr:hypothetical protein FQN54_004307 [Arachnomyces sp. PD_36]
MAGMEEIEVHSKSYLVRWVNVRSEHTISWSIQPHKKSLNFGIFKHPGHTVGSVTPSDSNSVHSGEPKDARNASSSLNVTEKLKGIGLKPISWIGKCEADKISQGTYAVAQGEGGNYALVIDNTFSKQISKTATFVLLTYPSNAPPHSGHQVHHSQAVGAPLTGPPQGSPMLKPTENGGGNAEVVMEQTGRIRGWSTSKRPPPRSSGSSNGPSNLVHTGILQKRRRRRHQGYARRFFSLDFTSSTLSYYHDRNSSALRGAMPLSLAAVATNAQSREISIDSGAEIWHLRATNNVDFDAWKHALEKASKMQGEEGRKDERHQKQRAQPSQRMGNGSAVAVEKEWAQVETLVGKVSGTRDAVRRLAKDTDPKYLTSSSSASVSSPVSAERRGTSPSPASSMVETNGDESVDSGGKKPFWKRKASQPNTHALFRKNLNAQLAVPAPGVGVTSAPKSAGETGSAENHQSHHHEEGMHDHLMALLRDLDTVVAEFSALISESKQRRMPNQSVQPRLSIESDISQEFFDATDGGNASPLLTIQNDSEEEREESDEETMADDADTLSGSEVDDSDTFTRKGFRLDNSSSLFPLKPKSLTPLPLPAVKRRATIAPPSVLPPSLIGFLRKNVGKDLSTISMPVSANEPLSLLQRGAETLEYSNLLDKAANATDGLERLIYVTAFAISPLSNSRVKERAIRKPFNPMLGETFELVREDRGFRFVGEKVSHRPVQLAFQADARDWSLKQSPLPTQKFWGKSMEIVTEGKARLTLHSSGEHFSWSTATSFLRNIIAGEKYVEPVGEMVVLNETTGQKTISTFKAGGMFSGRSEELAVKAFDTHGQELPLGLHGTWTTSLQLTEHGNQTNKTIWSAGPLVAQAPKHYGLTTFAAGLNEITQNEKDKLPVTDSRLRPDLRALEDGDLDRAEELKAAVEEGQRKRRKQMEEKNEVWRPRWFTKVEEGGGEEDGEVWKLRGGKDGYWEERAKGEWTGTVPIFSVKG